MSLDPAIAARLKRNEAGLFTAVVQERGSGDVLMVAWMDDEALARTIDTGRATYSPVTDDEAMAAFQLLCRTEGIIPALEPSHAIAAVGRKAREMKREDVILANLCGRGDKDIFTVAHALGVAI